MFHWCLLPRSLWLHIGNCILLNFSSPWGPGPLALPASVWGSCYLWIKFEYHTWCRCIWCLLPGHEHMGWLCVPYWVLPWRWWVFGCYYWRYWCLVMCYQHGCYQHGCYHYPPSCHLLLCFVICLRPTWDTCTLS